MRMSAWGVQRGSDGQLQGKTWPKSESVKECRFCYAKIQGDPNAVQAEAENAPKETVEEP